MTKAGRLAQGHDSKQTDSAFLCQYLPTKALAKWTQVNANLQNENLRRFLQTAMGARQVHASRKKRKKP